MFDSGSVNPCAMPTPQTFSGHLDDELGLQSADNESVVLVSGNDDNTRLVTSN
jgi:hypothetical protein